MSPGVHWGSDPGCLAHDLHTDVIRLNFNSRIRRASDICTFSQALQGYFAFSWFYFFVGGCYVAVLAFFGFIYIERLGVL